MLSEGEIRITDVEVFLAGTSWRNLTFVRISTDEGLTGWGEATVEYREDAVSAHIAFLRNIVKGLDALSPAAIWARLVDEDWFKGDIVGMAAAAGIITACLDVAGKAHDVPLYHLLGGRIRDRIPVYANGWYRGDRTPDSFASLAKDVVARGYRALKVDPFGTAGALATLHDLTEATALVGAIRDSVGSDIDIYVDVHGRLTPALARSAARLLVEHNVRYIEEPVSPENIAALRDLRATSPIAIAAGERCIGRTGFRSLIEADAVDIIQPDICWCGGPLEVQRIAAWAELHQMVVSLHNANSPFATMIGCHLGAVMPNFMTLESFDDFDEDWVSAALPGLPAVEDGAIPLSDRPGVGIEPDVNVLADHPPRPVFMSLTEPGWELRQAVIDA
jgi:galactonate dehydratase